MTQTTVNRPKILSLVNAEPGWVATVYYSETDDDGRGRVIATERHRVIGWALIDDGTTSLQPVYVESPGFPTCASIHNGEAPDQVVVYAHFEPDATDLTDPRVTR